VSNEFPIRIPERLPTRIAKSPIVETITEVRFVTPVPEAALQGLLFAQIRKKYPKYVKLPGAELIAAVKEQNPILQYAPVAQYHSQEFIIQTGPRSVSLLIQPAKYPGWAVLSAEIAFFFEALKNADFVSEGERLGLRYINFFALDVLSNLDLEVHAHGKPLNSAELNLVCGLKREKAFVRLAIGNNAMAKITDEPRYGSILDIDVSFNSEEFTLFDGVIERLGDAHLIAKQIFFGLLKQEFLDTLEPEYSPQ
jgi:uncharacterized protein (TIGR04255 family)